MLPVKLEKFKNSGNSFTARELAETYLEIKDRLTQAWHSSLSADSDGREEIYRQMKGLDALFDALIAEWSK